MQKIQQAKLYKLPIGLASGDHSENLKLKLTLINKFMLADSHILLELLNTKSSKKKLSTANIDYLEKLWVETELDDLDLTELFVCYLPKIIDSQNEVFLAKLDPQPIFNRQLFGDQYLTFARAAVCKSANAVSRFVLPRVRAKLVLREIIYLLTSDLEKLCTLIKITPKYLSCPEVADLILKCRTKQLLNNTKTANKKAANILKSISKAIYGSAKRQPKKYGYWGIDFFYNEVLACLKNAKDIKGKKNRIEYLKKVALQWGIPEPYATLIITETKKPTELTLAIMVEKKMIKDPSSYRNVIAPHVKKMKSKYPCLRACDYMVEHLLDWPTKAPDLFAQLDLWTQLEDFVFDLTEKEIKVGHAISYPTTMIRV